MENKKGLVIALILLIIIIIGGFFVIKNMKKDEPQNLQTDEYTPQEEISSSQARQTIVSLYFKNKETGELVPEARLIDIRELMSSPVERLVNLLIEGPKNSGLERIIPENIKLEKNYMDGDIAVLEFSEPLFTDETDEKTKNSITESIKNTLTQLTEVNDVKLVF